MTAYFLLSASNMTERLRSQPAAVYFDGKLSRSDKPTILDASEPSDLNRQGGMMGVEFDVVDTPATDTEDFGAEVPGIPPHRYSELFVALDIAIDSLASDRDPEEALRDSFKSATIGFAAKKSLLLVVEETTPVLKLRNLHVQGLTVEQVAACEQGISVPKVSSTLIREAALSGQPRVRHDARALRGIDETASMAEGSYSALCAPVVDPLSNTVLAVLYFQHAELQYAYTESDLNFCSAYAKALGRAFGVLLRERRRNHGREMQGATGAPDIVGKAPATQQLRQLLVERYLQAADVPNPYPILVYGETGTGKELVAKFLHAFSERRKGPYNILNCAGIEPQMAAPTFFGSKRGAYTSSVGDEPGIFRASHKGVLFLDEVGRLPLDSQGALLRALENRTVTPVGDTKQYAFNVMVILATNCDLDEEAARGRFLPDLLARFRVHKIDLKPLRERPLDIPALAEYFRVIHEKRYMKRLLGFTPAGMRTLVGYSWPLNVRELEQVMDLLVLDSKAGGRIDGDFIAATYPRILDEDKRIAHNHPIGLVDDMLFDEAIDLFSRDVIASRLEAYGWNVKSATESLGFSDSTMLRHMRNLGIKKPEAR